MAAFEEEILNILGKEPGLKGREIAQRLGIEKALANSSLFKMRAKRLISQDSSYRWALKKVDDQPAAPRNDALDTPLAKLCRYYLQCLSLDDEGGVSLFAESRYSPEFIEIPALPDFDPEEHPITSYPGVSNLLGQLRNSPTRKVPMLGYPVRLKFQKARSGWEGFNYGGVNYGCGYGGHGYGGGRWDGGHFSYNTAVNNVNVTNIHNTYVDRTTINNVTNNTRNVSYNGGNGGIQAQPTAQERQFAHQQRIQPTATQVAHVQAAGRDRSQLASVNGGKPATLAAPRPEAYKKVAQQHAAAHPFTPQDRVKTEQAASATHLSHAASNQTVKTQEPNRLAGENVNKESLPAATHNAASEPHMNTASASHMHPQTAPHPHPQVSTKPQPRPDKSDKPRDH